MAKETIYGVITVKVVGVHRTGAALMVVTPGRAGHRELQVTVSVTRGGVWRLSSA
jgi:hypothetical protein